MALLEKIVNELNLRLYNNKKTLEINDNDSLNTCIKSKIEEEESLLSFIQSISSNPINNDLQEAVKAYRDRIVGNNPQSKTYSFDEAFILGANWQKNQLINKIREC